MMARALGAEGPEGRAARGAPGRRFRGPQGGAEEGARTR